MEFTKEQQLVIEHRKGDLLVSAAAGSGKTTVMIERIIQLLLDEEHPVPLSRLLIMTFTNSATDQMKAKLEKELFKQMSEHPENQWVREQYRTIPISRISTNHSFSNWILSNYLTRIEGLDPGFRIMDETEAALLKDDVLSEVLESLYSSALDGGEEEFLALARGYGGTRQDTNLEGVILKTARFLESEPYPLEWLHQAIEAYEVQEVAEGETPAVSAEILNMISTKAASLAALAAVLRDDYIEAFTTVPAKSSTKTATDSLNYFTKATEALEALAAGQTEDYFASMPEIPRLASSLSWRKDPAETARRKANIDAYKKGREELGLILNGAYSPTLTERVRKYTYPALRGLEKVVTLYLKRLREVKFDKNVIEMGDMEHLALEILENEDVCQDLQNRFDYIFVDEYQDINRIQDTIIRKVARKNELGQSTNCFFVGDMKQSIYGFRQADPSIFLDKFEHYGSIKDTERMLLTANFRSDPRLLEEVNEFFRHLMTKDLGGIDYDETQRLNPSRPLSDFSRDVTVSMEVLEDPDKLGANARIQAEAQFTADRIVEEIQKGTKPSDITILMRTVNGIADKFAAELRRRGLEAEVTDRENFYDTLEIKSVINYLRILDNPRQDIPLLGAMMSAIGGFDEDELGRIRMADMKGCYYEALYKFAAQEKEDSLHQKARRFLTQAAGFREQSRVLSVHDLLWNIYSDTGFYLYVSSLPGGNLRQANLDLLLEKSVAFENSIYAGLYEFLRYVDHLSKMQLSEDEATVIDPDSEKILIQTIHKSKGLEYSVVFLTGLGRDWNLKDASGRILFNDKLGLGTMVYDTDALLTFPHYMYQTLSDAIKAENVAEEIRLLYVAMTRAKERLYLIGSREKAGPERTGEVVTGPLDFEFMLKGKNHLAMLEEIRLNRWESERQIPYEEYVIYEVKPGEQTYTKAESEMDENDDSGTESDMNQSVFDQEKTPMAAPSEELTEEDLAKLTYRYPHQWRRRVPALMAVSALKLEKKAEQERMITEEGGLNRDLVATFTEDETDMVSGADRGTAFHEIMARADLRLLAEGHIDEELARLVQSGSITEHEVSIVPKEWVSGFATSDLIHQVLEADAVYKEKPFIMLVSVDELTEYSGRFRDLAAGLTAEEISEEKVMIQGIIDCYFEKDGKLILFDYKTDKVLNEAKIAGYTAQLELYKKAIEMSTGKKVTDCFLYDVRRRKEIHC